MGQEPKSSIIPDPDSIADPILRLHAELRILRHSINNSCHLLMMNAELAEMIPDRQKLMIKLVAEKMPELQQQMVEFSKKFEATLIEPKDKEQQL
ncbi:MAG: hypothetical protein SGI71_10720 [Verrucomicrobiota bacterium]|nr:hypothetical protein [Verrucomicrobiota bacterium]